MFNNRFILVALLFALDGTLALMQMYDFRDRASSRETGIGRVKFVHIVGQTHLLAIDFAAGSQEQESALKPARNG